VTGKEPVMWKYFQQTYWNKSLNILSRIKHFCVISTCAVYWTALYLSKTIFTCPGMRVAENQERKSQSEVKHMHLGVWEKQLGFYVFLGQSETNRVGIKHDFFKPLI